MVARVSRDNIGARERRTRGVRGSEACAAVHNRGVDVASDVDDCASVFILEGPSETMVEQFWYVADLLQHGKSGFRKCLTGLNCV